MRPWIAVLALVLAASQPAAAFVLGGGRSEADCRVAFAGVDATVGASGVVCVDGDPACDRDGVVSGSCRFTVSVCTRVPEEGCAPSDITSLFMAGFTLAPPPLPDGAGACGPPTETHVAAGSAQGATVLAREGTALRDVDYLNLCCRSGVGRLDAARCALGVDLSIAGCHEVDVPAHVMAAFARARRLVDQAASDPMHAAAPTRKAKRALRRVRSIGRRVAADDACGYALGLIASHALASLGATAAGL